jgi:hypothetical protein
MTPPSDRLIELRRQRAMIREHVTWLDREIQREEQKMPAGLPPSQSEMTAAGGPSDHIPELSSPELGLEDDKVIEQFRVAPTDIQRDVRKGCLIYFAAAFLLLVAGVIGLYFALRH